ncbi:MAG: AAA family ATPase [Janthinobacterium lividum]
MSDENVFDSPLLRSLLTALEATPDDIPLRLHVAELFLDAGHPDAALAQVSRVLAQAPTSSAARVLMQRALSDPVTPAPAGLDGHEFDWADAEADLGPVDVSQLDRVAVSVSDPDGEEPKTVTTADLERPRITLADVAGMEAVKERLDLAFLGPLRNPELRAMYGKSLRGGLLLYGPPGCGKTFIARAVAGEMGASFLSVTLADVLDMWIGNSEKNLHELFQQARRNSPCVLFFDEVDGLGMTRAGNRSSGLRTTVQQFLAELDGMDGDNEGVFVLAATNAPWDVDPALRRPGRLDRMLLVLPPDEPARYSVLSSNLRGRPTERLDLGWVAKRTEGFSGADLAHLADTAVERALHDSIRTGTARPVGMGDLKTALSEVRPSTGAWFESARNVATYANSDGTWDDLLAHLRKRR